MVDKNLFLYDLAVVAILKNEGPYLKEWLDYHLLAGVNHFYLYDNDSPDNQTEVAKPYVEAGLVDYFSAPGKAMQMFTYNDAVKRFKFHCRYMAFIDGDEFIYPKVDGGGDIISVVDEILPRDPRAAGLAIHWQLFGSDGQDKADYSRGVLERFKRRALPENEFNRFIKIIADPRKTDYLQSMHHVFFFAPLYFVNEQLKPFVPGRDLPATAEKIVINHYYTKSKEEYEIKTKRGHPCGPGNPYSLEAFHSHDRNDIFDDGILKYRAARAEKFSLESGEQRINRVAEALTKTLSAYASGEMFSLETALTCRAVSAYLREKFPADNYWKVCEEASLAAIIKSAEGITFTDRQTLNENFVNAQLLVRELPNLLRLPYPVVKELKQEVLELIGQMTELFHHNIRWKDFVEADYLRDMLELI